MLKTLAAVGLHLHAQKTKIFTTQAQPPSHLQTPNGLIISVLDRESSHKWLGCMLMTAPVQTTTGHVECRRQAAARAFNANKYILCGRKLRLLRTWNILIMSHPPYRVLQQDTEPFTVMIYSVWMLHTVDFSSQWWGFSAVWTRHYHGMKFSTSGMSVFGPSPCKGSKSWSEICLRHHWNLAQYFATLLGHGWIKRVLAWQAQGQKRIGRPKYSWDSMVTNFCRLRSSFCAAKQRVEATIVLKYQHRWLNTDLMTNQILT